MLIMRRGEVMSQGQGLADCASYAKTHKTKVKSVEICSTLGGFYELVVMWNDRAVGMYWTEDRFKLRDFIAEQKGWPHHTEYSVNAMPMLLEHSKPAPAEEPEETPQEPDGGAGEPEVRVRRTRPVQDRQTPEKPAPRPAPRVEPPARIRRVRSSAKNDLGDYRI